MEEGATFKACHTSSSQGSVSTPQAPTVDAASLKSSSHWSLLHHVERISLSFAFLVPTFTVETVSQMRSRQSLSDGSTFWFDSAVLAISDYFSQGVQSPFLVRPLLLFFSLGRCRFLGVRVLCFSFFLWAVVAFWVCVSALSSLECASATFLVVANRLLLVLSKASGCVRAVVLSSGVGGTSSSCDIFSTRLSMTFSLFCCSSHLFLPRLVPYEAEDSQRQPRHSEDPETRLLH